ncbi:MAG: DUF937 domain-containing protein [Lysobacterales bacterium]|jgi:hypothetical protein
MNLLELLDSVGGQKSLGSLASNLGLDASKANDLVGALAPALMGALQKQTSSQDGLEGFKKALQTGKHQEYLSNPDSMNSADTVADGNNILGHIFGSKDVSRNVAAQAATSTGIDASLIKKALPLIASLAMGAMSKTSNAGETLDNSTSGLLGSLMGGDGFDMDDVFNIAKKFF